MSAQTNGAALDAMIFDKDGTLFDFNATWGAWAKGVLLAETATRPDQLAPLARALGYDLQTGLFEEDSLVIASTSRQVAEAAMPYLPDTDVNAVMARFNAAAARAPQIEATPLVAFFTQLRAQGLKLGVATNDADAPARAHLSAAGVTPLLDFIAGFDSGFGGKPAPGQLLAFCDATGVVPARCAMVGDSTHDLRAGAAAGMTTIAVLTGVAKRNDLAPFADVVLASIADIPDWLAQPKA